ncbi:MAG: hypothetical protein LW875_10820 [Proteobacteria bacterium]|jgi:hypothetical protein|nr:hypothetical protein [Pseudomonadota bacterium]
MVILRPTASLAKRMKVKLQPSDQSSSTRLGDWYALDIVLSRKQFILCVSSKSRLAVVLEAAPYATLPDRLSDAVTEVLREIGVSEGMIQEERAEMAQVVLAKTLNKSILGTMNDYRFQLEWADQVDKFRLEETLKMSMYLGKIISLALPEGYPRDAALKLFGQEPLKSKVVNPAEVEKPTELQRPRLYVVKS